MILKNLFRRKGRTLLTLAGIALGVAAIVALGAMAEGMRAGYTAMATGSRADLVLSQEGVMDITMGGIEETVGDQVEAWPEVAAVDGMLMGNVRAEESLFFYIFGYDPEGFGLGHFRIVEGEGLGEARRVRGKPLLLGRGAAQSLDKGVGDTLRMTGGTFRIVGIYETGDAFEEGAAVISLEEAQRLLLQPRRVSTFYVRLRDPGDEARLRQRVERSLPGLTISKTSEFADRQDLVKYLAGFAWGVAVLAIIIGGVGMTNTLFMSVFERTREIGLLRAVGWRRGQVLRLILGESLFLSLLGGMLGAGLGVVGIYLLRGSHSTFGAFGGKFSPELFSQALITVLVLGLVGGAYPAWWASRLLPLEALRYEGGASDKRTDTRLVWAGMTVRNLWRRRTRTLLTALGIGVGIAAIVALSGLIEGFLSAFTSMITSSQVDLMALEADASDMGYSAIDERVGARMAALPGVESVSGIVFAFARTEEMPLLIVMGYHPREFAIRHLHIAEGVPLTARRQAIVGRLAAETMDLEVGDTIRLLDSSFRVVGIFETGVAWEESSVVIGLQEAQVLGGKPRQVGMFAIKLRDPKQAEAMQVYLNENFPEVEVSLSSDFTDNIPDMERMSKSTGQIFFMVILIGAVGMLNTMLMSVLERTREIGVLRALGWRRRQVVGMVLREAWVLGLVGGICGILLGIGLSWAVQQIPGVGQMLPPRYKPELFVQVLAIALVAGTVGGLYPAWRATRMRPVEALRYE
jgi:ABC-type antimicrobial peptide transport system permease subunit